MFVTTPALATSCSALKQLSSEDKSLVRLNFALWKGKTDLGEKLLHSNDCHCATYQYIHKRPCSISRSLVALWIAPIARGGQACIACRHSLCRRLVDRLPNVSDCLRVCWSKPSHFRKARDSGKVWWQQLRYIIDVSDWLKFSGRGMIRGRNPIPETDQFRIPEAFQGDYRPLQQGIFSRRAAGMPHKGLAVNDAASIVTSSRRVDDMRADSIPSSASVIS